MPDLITHCLASRIIVLGRFKKYLLLFLIGAILPDVLSRVPHFFLAFSYRCSWVIAVFHSPLVLILFVLIFALLFKDKKQAGSGLFFGMVFHLFLDSFQRHIGGSYYWFFPFSFKTGEFGLFWPEESLSFIPYLILITLAFYGFELYRKGRITGQK